MAIEVTYRDLFYGNACHRIRQAENRGGITAGWERFWYEIALDMAKIRWDWRDGWEHFTVDVFGV